MSRQRSRSLPLLFVNESAHWEGLKRILMGAQKTLLLAMAACHLLPVVPGLGCDQDCQVVDISVCWPRLKQIVKLREEMVGIITP